MRGSENLSCYLGKLCTGAASNLKTNHCMNNYPYLSTIWTYLYKWCRSVTHFVVENYPLLCIDMFLQCDRCWTWCFSSEKVRALAIRKYIWDWWVCLVLTLHYGFSYHFQGNGNLFFFKIILRLQFSSKIAETFFTW